MHTFSRCIDFLLMLIAALFLIRDDEFTETLPGEIKDAFVDDNTLCTEKMKKLKEMLKEHFPVCMRRVGVGGGGGGGKKENINNVTMEPS